MVHRFLECLAVDGNYSKARICSLLLGICSIAVLIWLIVLSVQLGKAETECEECESAISAGTSVPSGGSVTTPAASPTDKYEIVSTTEGTCGIEAIIKPNKPGLTLKQCEERAEATPNAKFIFFSEEYKGKPKDSVHTLCVMYKACGKVPKRIVRGGTGATYELVGEDKKRWKEISITEKTCGRKYKVGAPITGKITKEQCISRGQRTAKVNYVFYVDKMNRASSSKSLCQLYKSCDLSKGVIPTYLGITYKVKL